MTKTNPLKVAWVALATALLLGLAAVLAFSVPASGEQSDAQNGARDTGKRDTGLTAQSGATAPRATFGSGSGDNFFGVKVSDHGNLIAFESAAGRETLFDGREGYAVCSAGGPKVHGHDTGAVEAGFGAPTFSQPTAGKFPLTITRKTTDGKFQLKQVWNKPDPAEKDVTITMTLKNISAASIDGVLLSRSGDFDVGETSSDQGARTFDSAWLWDDAEGGDIFPQGVMLTATSPGANHANRIEKAGDWSDPTSGTRTGCMGSFQTTPTAAGDFAMRAFYVFSNVGAGQSRTVKFEYRLM